jgi:hypothetical protein
MITQQIRSEIGAAMKARDTIRLNTLRGAVTAFTNELVAKGRKPTEELNDADAVIVLKRLAKQRKDSIEQFEKGGRADLVEKESAELKIIEAYLPVGASRADIERVAKLKIVELGVTDVSGIGNDVKEIVMDLLK